MTKIAIIGAGIAGLACARNLAQAGVQAVVFDKGRGIGGRVATRRAGNLRFDHGAPYVVAKGDDFAKCLRGLIEQGMRRLGPMVLGILGPLAGRVCQELPKEWPSVWMFGLARR